MQTVLIFAYYSYRDPVFQSAVLPYFQDFCKDYACRLVLLTFEKSALRMSKEQVLSLRQELSEQGIYWYHLSWHSGYFKIFKKVYDLGIALIYSAYLIYKYNIKVIYSEAFPGAIISHFIAGLTGCRHVVHTFEPHADSTLESGVWTETSWEYRLLKFMEKRVARGCSDILTATDGYIEKLQQIAPQVNYHRVPSCVDLEHFQFKPEARDYLRKQLGISESALVWVYLGKFGGMYWQEELPRFFLACKQVESRSFLLVITPEDSRQLTAWLQAQGLQTGDFVVINVDRQQVPDYLAAADVAICAVRQLPAKRYCSPIKNGEYWAVGLPVVIPTGISDDYLLAEKHAIGVQLLNTSCQGLAATARHALNWLQEEGNSAEAVRARARKFVEADRSVKSYRALYADILACEPLSVSG